MALLTRLLRHLSGAPSAPQSDDLAQLRAEVRELQAERLALVAEWSKTREVVLRHLQRAAQYSKLDEREGAPLARRVLEMKNLTPGGPR